MTEIKGVIRVGQITTKSSHINKSEHNTIPMVEANINFYTCCLGEKFVVIEPTRGFTEVYSYNKAINPIENISIVTGVTTSNFPTTHMTYTLILN